jgi:hypothetical protein
LKSIISSIDSNNIFYYNCSIDSSNVIDVSDMSSPNAWYDYNNIYNKFVISELNVLPTGDTIFPYIEITKGSQL